MGNLLPDFIIGGAPRSGTTFLCHALKRHPAVRIAEPFIPEPKVFLVDELAKNYRAEYSRLFQEKREGVLLGEKSSHYFENETACARIAKALPKVKLIFILREPAKRAFSNYLRSKANGLETLSFAEAIDCEDRRADPFNGEKPYVRPFDYVRRGRYDIFAQRYLNHFPRAHVGFYLFEDILRNPVGLLDSIQEFLGLEPVDSKNLYPGNINPGQGTEEALDPGLEKFLRQRFSSPVKNFAAISGLDVSIWGY